MKTSMNLKKRDILTDSLEDFWGKGATNNIQAPAQRQTMMPTQMSLGSQVESPQQAYNEYNEAGQTIKETVERGVNETQDLQPNVRAAAEYSNMGMAPTIMQAPQKPRNQFDIGGFDEMISKQMARERGTYGLQGNLGLGGMGMNAPKTWEEKVSRDVTQFKIAEMKATSQKQKQYNRLAMMDFARVSQAKAANAQAINRNYNEAANRQRMIAGLPVYESAWDSIAGGKRKVPIYEKVAIKDKDGNIKDVKSVKVGEELQRYGGLFGKAGVSEGVVKGMESVGRGMERGGNALDKLLDKATGTLRSTKPYVEEGQRKFTTKANDFKETIFNPEGFNVNEAWKESEGSIKTPKEKMNYKNEYEGNIPEKYSPSAERDVNDAMEDLFGTKKLAAPKDLREV